MNTRLLMLIGAGLIVIVGCLLFVFALVNNDAPDEPPAEGPVRFPVETVTELGDDSTVSLRLENGSTVQVPQFLSEEQSETASDENGLDVSFSEDADYQILYFPNDSYFLISLYAEPLRDVRLAAEAELREKLKLQDSALCALTLDVFVDSDVNEIYSGRDLGLSFCSGSVSLP